MKRTLAVLGLLATTSLTPALAADLSRPVYKAPPVTAPYSAYNWSGFYVGAHAGVGWSENDQSLTVTGAVVNPAALGGGSGTSFIGGAQVGYNWQFAPNWLIGIEGDISWTDVSDSASVVLTGAGAGAGANLAMSRDLNWLASVRGRLGYSWDRFLLYVTGGVAFADYDFAATATFGGSTASVAFGDTKTGWVLGVGGEWAFANNWTARIEYLHYDFDGDTRTFTTAAGAGTLSWSDPTVDVVRFGLNYKFGGDALMARY